MTTDVSCTELFSLSLAKREIKLMCFQPSLIFTNKAGANAITEYLKGH
jgi:hypothetical protein